MTDRKRMKAIDIFNESTYAFPKRPFKEAFPQIETFELQVVEFKHFFSGENPFESSNYVRKSFYSHNNPPSQYVNCSNSICYNGGIDIGRIFSRMVREKTTFYEDSDSCQGYEGSPKGQKNYGPCDHEFYVRITLKYKT